MWDLVHPITLYGKGYGVNINPHNVMLCGVIDVLRRIIGNRSMRQRWIVNILNALKLW